MRRIFLAGLIVLSPVCASAGQWADNASLRLTRGETVQQATRSVAGVSSWDRVTTCGTTSQTGPWQCRIIGYLDGQSFLQLAFSLDPSGVWRLSDWSVGQ